MRKFLFIMLFALSVTGASAQSFTRQGNTFTQVSTTQKSSAQQTKYTWKDREGKTYPIYLSKNGRAFVYRTSKNTGKEYKQYLGEEISRQICKELGVTYKEK